LPGRMSATFRPETVLRWTDHRPYPVAPGPWARGNVHRGDVHHRLLSLRSAEVETLAMTEQIGVVLPETEPLLHFSERLDVLAWLPHRLAS
jgi:hypothetical protein